MNSEIITPTHTPHLFRRMLLSWLTAVTMEYLLLAEELRNLSGLKGLAQMSLPRILVITAILMAVLSLLGRRRNTAKAERWAMVAIFAILSITAVSASPTLAFGVACAALLLMLIVYACLGWRQDKPRRARIPRDRPVFLWITIGVTILFFLVISAWTVGRVLSFGTGTYDFGLFAQMFHSMKTTGLPLTTLERDGLLSHFAVHVSPIFYLILPLYWLFPDPATLQVAQAAVMASSVIPLWLLGKHHGLTGLQRCLLCVILLAFPAFACGASYDLHENCFLTPLLLWLLYGLDRGSTPITAISAILTLMVKEDAAVYAAVIGLFYGIRIFLHRGSTKKIITALSLVCASIVWFFLVTGYLSTQGDGVMTYRYNNFIYDRSASLLSVIKAVLMNPLKAVYECVDPEKLAYIGLTLGPLLGLPLLTRRYERYVLLIPYVLVNLMSDYPYQHDIFFQYNFGSTACLIYLTVVNLADLKIPWKRLIPLGCAAVISLSCFSLTALPDAIHHARSARVNEAYYQALRDRLDQIPADASVTSSSYYTTYLSRRETLYDVRYASRTHLLETEYVALDARSQYGYDKYGGLDGLRVFLEDRGYTILTEWPGVLVIYQAPDA